MATLPPLPRKKAEPISIKTDAEIAQDALRAGHIAMQAKEALLKTNPDAGSIADNAISLAAALGAARPTVTVAGGTIDRIDQIEDTVHVTGHVVTR